MRCTAETKSLWKQYRNSVFLVLTSTSFIATIDRCSLLREANKLCIPFEESLSEEQIDVFHKILDCVIETAAEMRTTYKVGFKDSAAMMQEIQD